MGKRHQSLAESVAIALLISVASVGAMAGWSSTSNPTGWNTNVWPAWQHPRDTMSQMSDCFWALQERRAAFLNATNWPGVDTNLFASNDYRKFRYNMDILRNATEGLWLTSMGIVDGTVLDESGTLNAYFATNQGELATIPRSSAITNLMKLTIPTNFFTIYSGPYRVELSGLGGYTNDIAAIGHAHGFTNELTMAGGTNYPAGRTNWYTTDYGLDNLKAILQSVKYTPDDIDHMDYVNTIAYQNSGTGGHASTWAEAKTWAEANEVDYSAYQSWEMGTVGEKWGASSYFATWSAFTWRYRVYSIGIATNVNKSYAVYQYAEPMGYGYPGAQWDPQGFPVLSNQYAEFWTTNIGTSRGITSSVMGRLTFSGMNWCSTPTNVGGFRRGFSTSFGEEFCRGLIKWTFNYN